VEGSLLTWIAHLEENYDDCVVAAAASRQPTAPFTDPEAAFNADRKIELPDSGCNTNLIGCLYGAELRPYCLIDDDGFTDAGTCDQAGNLEDPNGPVGGDSGGSGGVLEDVASQPFGDIESLVNCSRPRLCTIEEELVENFALNYNQFYNEGVEFNLVTVGTWPEYTGLQVTGLELGDDAKELLDAFDIRNNDVITHVNGEALDSGEAVWEIVGDLFDVSTWEITGRRQVFPGNGWKAIEYDISLATSLTRRPAPSDLAVRANDETTGSSEASGEASGCGCASGGSSPASFAAMLLGFLGLRPRHWRRRWSARRR
jgi:hypothetical protein